MSLQSRVNALAVTIAGDVNALAARVGVNADLATTTKSTFVGALNEVRAVAIAAAQLDDSATASTAKTWSVTKITAFVDGRISNLVGAAPAALDTIYEIAAQLQADGASIGTIMTALGKRVRVDDAQTFTAGEQTQARSNIGAVSSADVGNTEADFAGTYTAARGA